jgi:branched-chain amino acid transport system permease protein
MVMAALQLTVVYVMLAYSVHIAVRAGMFSLAGVACYAIGGYAAAILVGAKVWTPLAILAAVVLSAVIGALLSLIVSRLRNLYLAMATIACVLLVRVIAIEGGDLTGGALGLFGIRSQLTLPIAAVLALLVTVGVIFVERGRSGRTLEALRLDEQLAASSGIVVPRVRRIAFTASAALGGLAGASAALLFRIFTPDEVSFELIVDALTMLVLGGTAAWYGPLIGAAIVAWLPVVFGFASDFRAIIQALVVVLVMIFLPDGAVGLIRGLARRRPRPAADAEGIA